MAISVKKLGVIVRVHSHGDKSNNSEHVVANFPQSSLISPNRRHWPRVSWAGDEDFVQDTGKQRSIRPTDPRTKLS